MFHCHTLLLKIQCFEEELNDSEVYILFICFVLLPAIAVFYQFHDIDKDRFIQFENDEVKRTFINFTGEFVILPVMAHTSTKIRADFMADV